MIVKSAGSNGQITLGKEFAGRLVMLDQTAPGVWVMSHRYPQFRKVNPRRALPTNDFAASLPHDPLAPTLLGWRITGLKRAVRARFGGMCATGRIHQGFSEDAWL